MRRFGTRGWLLATLLQLCVANALAAEAAGGPTWGSLSAAQRHALAPLAADWENLDPDRKQKWLEISQRFPTMSADRQQRVQQRMTDWARLTPQQRTEARSNFQQSKRLPTEERQAQWQAYQALPEDQRKALAERSRPEAGDTATEPRRKRALRDAAVNAQERKSNLVGVPAESARAPRAVAPTVIQGNPGATTSLITRSPAPPPHQQAGLPKISAGPGMVDRATLLPQRGPQGAAVRPAPQASGNKR